MHGNDTIKSQKILIVDSSRVVRASLARRLHKTHLICEEGDGESAWQSLVLDASIVAVISGLDVGSLDGAGLIERMRASKLARLNGMPFYLLASDSMPEVQRQRALFLGVSDFIPKASPGPVLHRLFVPGEARTTMAASDQPAPEGDLDSMTSSIGLSDFSSRIGRLAGLDMGGGLAKDDGEYERRLAEKTAQHCVEQHLSQGADRRMASVLIFGIDGYADLCDQFGRQLAEKVVSKFSALLAGKIQERENVLHLAEGRIGIVSACVTRDQCAAFARRVCKALASASIGLGGRQISATVSAGISAVPQDGEALSAEELLYLATHRLDAAQEAGGNQVVHSSIGTSKLSQDEFVGRLKTLLANSPATSSMSCKSWLRSICMACRDTRPEGEPPPCSAGLSDGLCGGRQAAKH